MDPRALEGEMRRGGVYYEVTAKGDGFEYRIFINGELHTTGWRREQSEARNQAREDAKVARGLIRARDEAYDD